MNSRYFMFLSAALLSVSLAACGDDENDPNPNPDPEPVVEENVSGNVSGTWEKNSIINVSGHITVPEGESLTIEEGVTVVFSSNGVGASHTPIEFVVDGDLYCLGTEESPVTLTVAENERTPENAFEGLWGGIIATDKCEEILLDHTIIEYTGGLVGQDSPSAVKGIYTPGDDMGPQLTTNNINGKYVVTNSILRYGASDAIYMMGGNGIIMNNIFSGNGADGGEAVNVKAGCKVDVAGNVMYSPNTNGLKLSSSGQNDEGGRSQALIRAYNNTIINAGWRRDGVKGGGIYVEKNALVSVFNNLLVNCKFKAMTPSWNIPNDPEEGYADASIIDYNFYTSGASESTLDQDIANGTTTSFLGYTSENEDYNPAAVDLHSVVSASAGDKATNPMFVNFPYMNNPLDAYVYDNEWDFHVAANSPVLSNAYSGNEANMQPYFAASGLTVNGQTYTSPMPQAWFGAFGAN
ncbi:MAG: hypothetical protein IAB88_09270 [Bacteroidetes bacterium]|uniref:Right handed beta helix domain-containing protein n=1 Tax=Candidatus Limisoma faecipullorum TaxID=2840854 RepID=A0A9D9NKT5_9BACT|nr:hypothetical protein [Candidatus Limisoma faecipullorum]